MNDSDLEDQLRSLTPAAPSAGLATRIEKQLSASNAVVPTSGAIVRPSRPSAWRWLRDLGWATAGAVAMLIGITLFSADEKAHSEPTGTSLSGTGTPPVATGRVFEPENTSRELIAVTDSPELLDTGNGLVRQVRYTYRERLGWTRPDTGARLEVELPREDVYLLPVSLQ